LNPVQSKPYLTYRPPTNYQQKGTKTMPTYKLTTTSTQFLYGSPEQLHDWVTDLPSHEAVTELSQVNDLDVPEGVNPISLGWIEILDNGGESPESWASMAKAQLDRLEVFLEVTPVSEAEAEAYSGDKYERFLWVGSSLVKLLFPAVELVVALNRLTLAEVEDKGFWGCSSHLALKNDSWQLTKW
jgi:hypothetical protein